MGDDAANPAQPATSPSPVRSRGRSVLKALGWVLALPVALVIGAAAWLLGTQSGLDAAIALAQRVTAGALQVQGARGRVLGRLDIERLDYRSPALELGLRDFTLAWQPSALLSRRLQVDVLSVARVDLGQVVAEDEPASPPPPQPPGSLEIPLAVEIARLAIGAFAMHELPAPGAPEGVLEQAAETLERAADAASDPAQAAEATTEVAAEQGLIFTGLEAALDSDGRLHHLRELVVDVPQGRARLALALAGASPFKLEGEGGFEGVIESRPLSVSVTLGNSLLEPQLRAEASSDGLQVRLEAAAESFAPNPLRRLHLEAGELDPAAFVDGAPTAALRLVAELAAPADGEGLLTGPLRLDNRLPAAADAGGIPLQHFEGVLDWRVGRIALDALAIRLPGEGRIDGSLAWAPPSDGDDPNGFGRVVAALALAGIDTQALDTRLPRQIVAGRVDAEADADRQSARIGLDVGAARIDAEAALEALAASGPSAGQTNDEAAETGQTPGQAATLPALRVARVDARIRGFDPRAVLPEAPRARLDLDLVAEAELPAEGLPKVAALDFTIPDSVLEGLPLSGEGRVRLQGERLPELRVRLDAAGNTLAAQGALGGAADTLSLRLDAPALSRLGKALGLELAGRLGAEGQVGGTVEAPNGQLQFFGEKLVLPGDVALDGVNGSVRLERGIDGPFALALGLSGLGPASPGANGKAQPDWLAGAQVAAEGSRAQHRFELSAQTPEQDEVADTLRLVLQGGVLEGDAPRWRGELAALETAGRFAARLLAPAPLSLAADRVSLGAANIDAGQKGRIRLQETTWSPTRSVLRGELAGLVLDLRPPRADGRPRRNADPLTLGAKWDLAVGKTLEGEARVFRESGDLSVEGEIRTRLGLEGLEAVLRAQGDRLRVTLDARGREFGSVQAEAGLRARRDADGMWSVPPATALSGAARLDMPSITWLGRLARENVETAGRIAGEFTLGGTLEAPSASGRVEGRELAFTLIDQGLILAGGELDLDFDDERVRLERLEFVSDNRVRPPENRIPFERLTATPGRFTARGEVVLASGAGNFRFDADRQPLLQRDDRWMLVSGEGSARSTWTSPVLDAGFRADAGYIEFAESLPPSLSDDVIVLKGEAPAEGGGAFTVDADVRVGLGDALYLSAMGLETRLAGDLRIRLQPGRPLSAVGTISTVGGGFRGYGQNLTIERGLINFQGPLDAPGLNIVALRKGLEVEAGVSVTGSAKRPQIRLVSEPNVPDPAKLSWIVLGRAPDAGSGADLGLLLPAAAGLLGGPGGGMTEELSRSLGFDSFSFGQGELNSTSRAASSRVVGSGSTVASGPSVAGQVLSLGKRLGPDLFLSFEQSLGGAATLVKLTYQLSRRMSVIARGGTDTALDLQYGFSFR